MVEGKLVAVVAFCTVFKLVGHTFIDLHVAVVVVEYHTVVALARLTVPGTLTTSADEVTLCFVVVVVVAVVAF